MERPNDTEVRFLSNLDLTLSLANLSLTVKFLVINLMMIFLSDQTCSK